MHHSVVIKTQKVAWLQLKPVLLRFTSRSGDVGQHQHQPAHQCSICISTHTKCEVKGYGDGDSWLKWVGYFWLKWVGHLWFKWVVHFWLRWVGQLGQSELLFFERYAQNQWSSCMGVPFPAIIWPQVSVPLKSTIHVWTIKEPHLSYKTGLDVTQSHPLHRTRFSQYQASSAALGWPGDGDCHIMHRMQSMQSGGWPYSKVGRDS